MKTGIVINKDVTIPFDVDATLIYWKPEGAKRDSQDVELDYYGEKVYVHPHLEHIRLLRASLARGRNVIVWSGNGYLWAKTVIDYLLNAGHLPSSDGMIIMSKPVGYVDDLDCQHWMGNRIYIKPHSNPYSEGE
jgi:hypothetical protein